MDIYKLKDDLRNYKSRIINQLSKNKWKFFNYYFNINENYRNNNINEEFKKSFCNFYRLNGARGLNNDQKIEFFKLLERKENNIEKILSSLYEIPGYGNRKRLELSFSSKLLHTLNNNLAIYDNNISEVLKLNKKKILDNFEQKLKNRLDIYEELQRKFKVLLKDKDIINYLVSIREELKNKAKSENFDWKDDLMTEVKLLDFVLWALFSVKNKVKIILGDITKIKTDAIVNPANKSLLGGGGCDGAIHQTAGPKLLKECISLNGCEKGEAKITKGYNLPAKYIIHTVGPVFGYENDKEQDILTNCYINTFKLAKEYKIKTIAFPNIGTGCFRYPKDEAAEIAINVAKQFLDDFNEITFVCFTELDYRIYNELNN